MPVPWLLLLDTALNVGSFARGRRRGRRDADETEAELQTTPGRSALGRLETHLAGVVVAALKEVFDRDTRRLEFERERAERGLRLALRGQAADREIGRLRLLAAVAVVSWLGTLFFSGRLIGAGLGARVALGGAWLLQLTALAVALIAQGRVAAALDQTEEPARRLPPIDAGMSATVAPWLVVSGLALVALASFLA